MRHSHLISVAAGVAAALTAASEAFAADAVFGGSTTNGDPIVVRSDPDIQELRSLGLTWRAECDDGTWLPGFSTLTPVKPAPGFSPAGNELLVSRNAKGTFTGTQFTGGGSDTMAAAISVEAAGKLKPARATGTLHAVVKIMDKATGASVTSCEARLRWTASRKPGIIYGGVTSQDEPIVLRLNAARERVNDVILAWHGQCATSGGFVRSPEHFVAFGIKRTGRFGNPFESESPLGDGGMSRWQYRFTGRVTPTKASGAFQVTLSETDAAGAMTDTCDSGNLTWKSATG